MESTISGLAHFPTEAMRSSTAAAVLLEVVSTVTTVPGPGALLEMGMNNDGPREVNCLFQGDTAGPLAELAQDPRPPGVWP